MKCFVLIAISLALVTCGAAAKPNGSTAETVETEPHTAGGANLERYELEVGGHTLIVWEKAPVRPKGVVVLVHGRTWSSLPDFDLQVPGENRSLMDALVGEGYVAIAVDLCGYGATKRDASGWLSPNTAAADLAEVLRWAAERSGGAPAVLGWSYGALVSHLCAQQAPELFSSLILYGYPRGIDTTYAAGPTADKAPARLPTTREAAAEDFVAPGAATPGMVEAFVDAAVSADPIRVDWRDLDQFNVLDPAKVSMPVLLVHGEHDPYAPVERQSEVFKIFANADRRWVVLPGGDHAAHLESTGPLFVRTIVDFLRRPVPGR